MNHPSKLDIINNSNNHPKIQNYQITFNSIESNRFGGFISDNKQLNIVSNHILYNSNNNLKLDNLLEGHKYELKIKSSNSLNSDFSESSDVINFTTKY